ncbi:MAG: PAS domain S-box protein [Bacteroidales bacterium]|nr:PAS domain S-box protein [Bacteroidales bacterium]
MESSASKERVELQLSLLRQELMQVRESLKVAQMKISEYEQITENAQLAIIRFSPDGAIEYLNPFAQTLFNLHSDPKELKSITRLVVPEFGQILKSFSDLLHEMVEQGLNFYQHEKRLITRDNQIFWIGWTNQILFDPMGKVTGLVALGSDITSLKLTELALRQSEFNLKKAHEVAKTGSWVWEIGSDNIQCSELFFRIFGIEEISSYSQLQLLIKEIIFPEYLSFIKTKIDRAVRKGTTESYSYRIRHPLGGVRWIMEEVCLLGDTESIGQLLVGTIRDITEQKATEDKLREYLLIVSSSSELMSLISPDYRYINVNQAYLDAYKKPMNEIEGHTVSEMFGDEVFKKLIKPNIDRCLLGETISDQYWNVFADGKRRFMDVKYNPVREFDGTISGVTVSTRDITELKNTEEQLKIFRMFAEESGVGFGMADLEGRITYVNTTLCHLTGFNKPSEVIGKEIRKTYLRNHINLLNNEVIPAVHHKSHWTGEIDLLRIDGKVVHTIQNFFLIRNDDGEPVSYALSVTDISDRKIAEKALQRSETNFRSIFTNAAIGIDVVDENGKFLQVNDAMAEMMGYTKEELTELNISDITFPDDNESSVCSLADLFQGKSDCYRLEKRYVRKDGSIFWADLSVTVYYDPISHRQYAIGTIIDITQAKTLQLQLERSREEAIKANMAKSEFLANMSHEIRTPLNAVIGFTELLETLVSDKKQISYLESIKSGGKNLLLLINDILDLSKIEAGKMSFRFEPVNPYSLINEIKQIFSLKISEKNLDFIIDVDENIPASLILDEVRLRQVIFNLIGNAIKFTDLGYVKFSVKKIEPPDDTSRIDLKVTVEDTGIGIPADQHEIIFDAFQQQSGHNTRKYGGTGLGLSISKRLVEMMGGTIHLTSEVGKGSKFTFTLHNVFIGASIDLPDDEEDLNFAGLEFYRVTILIVDDVSSNRKLLKENLINHNFMVIEAEDGSQAVQLAELKKPEIIFMDIRMPVMDGFEASKIIKTNPDNQNVKIIALTASFRNEAQEENYTRYFDGYLHKPVTRSELFKELMRFVNHRQTITDHQEGKFCQSELNFNLSLTPGEETELQVLIDETLMPKWERAYRHQLSDEMKTFADLVTKAGIDFNLHPLKDFGSQFLVALDSFELDHMENCLKNFPKLISKIKDQLTNK